MSDNIGVVWDKFFTQRQRPLWERFPGHYRALVVETDDPLNIGRVRFKCPDLHDFELKPEECPWAVPSPDLGGKRAGRFIYPIIGDWIWIVFERQHPYGPIWVGFADETRRKRYTLPQVHNITPMPVNDEGKKDKRPKDYDKDYLPKDGRPMAHGWVDRYGNIDIHSSVGFYPKEHDTKPPPPDHDAIQGSNFEQQSEKPLVNDPDKKYMARITKYGHISLMGDQGYHWKKESGSTPLGEFSGDAKEDDEFETKRWLFLQRLLNDDVPRASDTNGDQRKQLNMTRYGSRIEMRDTGWAQQGPIESKSREGEFGPARILSKESKADYRWIKIRTKGGMLWQAYDKGFHPQEDTFIKRSLLEESGPRSEQEDKYWADRDARWIRTVTRYGIKIVLDDRGSDDKDAHKKEYPRGIGVLIKGRRTPGSKNAGSQSSSNDPRGFYWEFNERDDANHTSWGSPLGQVVEINDRYQYIMIASALGKGWVRKWMGLKDNEFSRKPTMMADPESTSHHLKIDHDNEYIRFKTRAGKGNKPDRPVVYSGVSSSEINQGIEARDGENGDGPWVEMVDCQHRGFWLSKTSQLSVWRGQKNKRMYQWFDDSEERKIVVYNNQVIDGEPVGVVEIYVGRDVRIISNKEVHIQAAENIHIKTAQQIRLHAGETKFTIYDDNRIKTTATIYAKGFTPSPGGESVTTIDPPQLPSKLEPTDRAKTYNKPYLEAAEPK